MGNKTLFSKLSDGVNHTSRMMILCSTMALKLREKKIGGFAGCYVDFVLRKGSGSLLEALESNSTRSVFESLWPWKLRWRYGCMPLWACCQYDVWHHHICKPPFSSVYTAHDFSFHFLFWNFVMRRENSTWAPKTYKKIGNRTRLNYSGEIWDLNWGTTPGLFRDVFTAVSLVVA